jgi:hypothetical protein
MTPSAARVIDPVLSEVARGYGGIAQVADVLFPRVPVGQRGGRIINFGAEDFRVVNSARAPGSNTKRVSYGYSSSSFALVDYSMEGSVPIELLQEAAAVPGIDLAQVAIRKVRNQMAVEREVQCATLARTAATYGSNTVTLSSTDQWDDPANTNVFTAINTGKEAVRAGIGRRPNVMIVGPKVFAALSIHAKVLDKLSTSVDRTPATAEQLAALFGLERVIEGSAVSYSGTAFSDVWGNDAILAYVTPASLADMGSPNFGYTYQLDGYPVAEEPYYDRNTKTWYFPVTDARAPVFVGPSAGYLFVNAV